MKKTIQLLALSLAFLISCSPGKKGTSAGDSGSGSTLSTQKMVQDGLSFETAVVIKDKSESKGVDAEYAWIREHYPGSKFVEQKLTRQGKKPYDIIEVTLPDGRPLSLYFDISNFFGKF